VLKVHRSCATPKLQVLHLGPLFAWIMLAALPLRPSAPRNEIYPSMQSVVLVLTLNRILKTVCSLEVVEWVFKNFDCDLLRVKLPFFHFSNSLYVFFF